MSTIILLSDVRLSVGKSSWCSSIEVESHADSKQLAERSGLDSLFTGARTRPILLKQLLLSTGCR